MTLRQLRYLIESEQLDAVTFESLVEQTAKEFDSMSLGTQKAYKEYIRKGAELLKISPTDAQEMFNRYYNKD